MANYNVGQYELVTKNMGSMGWMCQLAPDESQRKPSIVFGDTQEEALGKMVIVISNFDENDPWKRAYASGGNFGRD